MSTSEQVTREADVSAPRTYQSLWTRNDDDTERLLTAEDWLEEQAEVDERLSAADPDGDDDGPNFAGILRGIAKEIATLRREKGEWAAECTQLARAVPHAE